MKPQNELSFSAGEPNPCAGVGKEWLVFRYCGLRKAILSDKRVEDESCTSTSRPFGLLWSIDIPCG